MQVFFDQLDSCKLHLCTFVIFFIIYTIQCSMIFLKCRSYLSLKYFFKNWVGFYWKSVKIAFLATLHKWDMFKVIVKQCVKVSSSISMTFWLRQQRQEAVCLARPLQGCKEKIGFLTMHLFVNHLQECDRYMAAILNASGVCNVSFLWPSFLWISYSRHRVTESLKNVENAATTSAREICYWIHWIVEFYLLDLKLHTEFFVLTNPCI